MTAEFLNLHLDTVPLSFRPAIPSGVPSCDSEYFTFGEILEVIGAVQTETSPRSMLRLTFPSHVDLNTCVDNRQEYIASQGRRQKGYLSTWLHQFMLLPGGR